MLLDEEDKPSFNQANVGKCLGMCNIDLLIAKPGKDGKQIFTPAESGSNSRRYDVEESWSGPKDQQH